IEFLVINCSVLSGLFSSVQNANSNWLHCILEVNLLKTLLHTEYRWGEYNLKDSGLIHALEPCPISPFFCLSSVHMFEIFLTGDLY
ncbi:hypothetical protein Goshw_017686, partial [Gossypium schwendimanii]|nr:hypothetical protein [Gossypium schwendimanii]